jgi:hypothetical protein
MSLNSKITGGIEADGKMDFLDGMFDESKDTTMNILDLYVPHFRSSLKITTTLSIGGDSIFFAGAGFHLNFIPFDMNLHHTP